MNNEPGTLELILPLLLIAIPWAIAVGMLANDKGRNVLLWVVLALIPIVNFFAVVFIIGASNLRVEQKIDEILSKLNAA